jgi:signal peptidase I
MEGVTVSSENYSDNKQVNQDWKKGVMFYLHDLIYMLITILLVFLLFFRVIVVSGDSMYSTLLDGDYLLLLGNLFYQEPQRGDIVVISKKSFDDGKPIVKRVIATEGQTVDIDFENAVVYVDGLALEEPYINSPTNFNEGNQFPLTVAENCIFVLGDNRGVSRDSRDPVIGQIDRREVLGKAIFLMIPGSSHGNLTRDTGRIGVIK